MSHIFYEYQLMVEHFADAVLKREILAFTAHDSVYNMQALDALAEAARTGKTITMQWCAAVYLICNSYGTF